MEWLILGGLFLYLHHTQGGAVAGAAIGNVPPGAMPMTGPARPVQVAPGSDVIGSSDQQYGRGFGNTVGQASPYPPSKIQNWLPLTGGSLGKAVTGGAADTGVAPGGPQDQGGADSASSVTSPTAGYIIGRGY